MAIVQISQITNRKGLAIDLPQLAGAELGWSTDTRQLWIGNGTLEDGAPVIGNTEILTEFSDILDLQPAYTYKGLAAGYTVQTSPTGIPVTQSLQSWLDQFATIKDFGAVGDGVTDDTVAINWALSQLYCQESNPQIRRSLFFPAGVYRVTETILIPPYANLWGEGADSSIIQLDNSSDDSTLNAYVARTVDSLQQYGVNIGTNGAQPPQFITISNLGFQNQDLTTDVFLVEDASNCNFQNVSFAGPLTQSDLTVASADSAGIRFASTVSLVCTQIVFDSCQFSGTTFGVNTDQQVKGVTISNSRFGTLYQGILLGTNTVVNGGPTGVRMVSNMFDNIYAEGIIFGDVQLNASGHNIFYDVGNHFNGITNPATTIIDIQSNNNVSISDLFARTDAFAAGYPRIVLNGTSSISTVNSRLIHIGQYTIQSGVQSILFNNVASPTSVFTVNVGVVRAFVVNYTILRDTAYRTGSITVASSAADSTGDLSFNDDYVENNQTGINLTVTESSDVVTVSYTSTNTGQSGAITYSITYLA